MTHQPPNLNHHDNTDEASSLFLTVAGGGVPATKKKKNGGVPRRGMIAKCVLLGTLAMIYSSSRRSDHAPAATTTTLNKDVLLVGVHEEEQVEGARCCPENRDGCIARKGAYGFTICADEDGSNKWKDLGNGTMCEPKLGGHCCGHETFDHYSWTYIHVGGCTGCCKDSF